MTIEIPEYAEAVLSRLEQNGEEAYIVGGSLRDSLLGKAASDYDVATSALPEQMIEIFKDHRVIATGLKHGTMTVISDTHPIEVTTFRVDGGYSDSRHPDSVSFTRSIEEDVSRRDFTVNAMAYSQKRGLVDLFGGREDLAKGIIRAVGDPERRFCEDALRIMRAFRFSAQLNFEIEENTLAAAQKCREGLARIARERISCELFKLLGSSEPERPLVQMCELGIAEYIFGRYMPERELVALLPQMPRDPAARLGLLLCKADRETTSGILGELRCSNKQRSTALAVAEHSSRAIMTQSDVSYLRKELGERAEVVMRASVLRGYTPKNALELLLSDIAPHSISELEISGNDLLSIGYSGREIGKTLSYLLDAAIDDPSLNTHEDLIVLARKKYEENTEKKGE